MNGSGFPEFPGAIGISKLNAYPWSTAAGEHGGSPHMHLACTEACVVVSGRGRLQTLNRSGPATRPLGRGDVVWFTAGTIHRALRLEQLVRRLRQRPPSASVRRPGDQKPPPLHRTKDHEIPTSINRTALPRAAEFLRPGA